MSHPVIAQIVSLLFFAMICALSSHNLILRKGGYLVQRDQTEDESTAILEWFMLIACLILGLFVAAFPAH